jgi:hypothetical protein
MFLTLYCVPKDVAINLKMGAASKFSGTVMKSFPIPGPSCGVVLAYKQTN